MYKIRLLQNCWWSISFALLWMIPAAHAQKQAGSAVNTGYYYAGAEKSITDTLRTHFPVDTAALYPSQNGGFASGNSGYGEKDKIQEFEVLPDSNYVLEGCLFWFGYKHVESQPGDSSAVILKLYDMDSSALINGISRRVPKTLLDTQTVLLEDLDTSSVFQMAITPWLFSSRLVARNYSFGIDLNKLYFKDTVALYTTRDDEVDKQGLSWEFWQGGWNTLFNNWGLNINLAVFPLVDLSNVGVGAIPGISSSGIRIYPNPAPEYVSLAWKPVSHGTASITLMAVDGRIIEQREIPVIQGADQRAEFNITGLASGTYILLIRQNGKGMASKFLVQH